ncbi:hypothetical protein [Ideonella sp.]|uniref:hypothetical protein n=1 Tax=Ideonella sp. TaxID=1929293 RepID=UPI0035B3E8B1
MAELDRLLSQLRSSGPQARERHKADTRRREAATTILHPNEVTGEYDAGRMLQTTLGGTGALRALTHDDLRSFSRNVKTAGRAFRGGITAKAIIDRSDLRDRDLANREIHTAVPVSHKGARVHFVTNAGPHSKDVRHHVHVELMNYANAISAPGKVDTIAKALAGGPLKFDCDCGRHTFWYRFISTIGGFNAGRPEQGYPKIRNPNLRGIACKHVLRVMRQLSQPNVRAVLVRMLERGRARVRQATTLIGKDVAQEIARQQLQRRQWKASQVETTNEKVLRLGKAAVQQVVTRKRAAAGRASAGPLDTDVKRFVAAAQKMAAAGVLSAQQLRELQALVSKVNR